MRRNDRIMLLLERSCFCFLGLLPFYFFLPYRIFFSQADVTPERQAVLDRLSSGQVFPSSTARSNGAGKEGQNGGGTGSSYANGSIRDPPAQPNFVGGPRCGRRCFRGVVAVAAGGACS